MTGGNAFTAERAISRPRDTTPHRLTDEPLLEFGAGLF
jgi:hypothetical protein